MFLSLGCALPQLITAFLVHHLFQSLIDREAARLLSWRELLKCCQELPYDRLCRNQDEDVLNEPSVVITRLMFRTLEWVGAQVDSFGARSGINGWIQTSRPCAGCSMNTALYWS